MKDSKGNEIKVGDRVNGVIYLCTKPSWGARPEFVERIIS